LSHSYRAKQEQILLISCQCPSPVGVANLLRIEERKTRNYQGVENRVFLARQEVPRLDRKIGSLGKQVQPTVCLEVPLSSLEFARLVVGYDNKG